MFATRLNSFTASGSASNTNKKLLLVTNYEENEFYYHLKTNTKFYKDERI